MSTPPTHEQDLLEHGDQNADFEDVPNTVEDENETVQAAAAGATDDEQRDQDDAGAHDVDDDDQQQHPSSAAVAYPPQLDFDTLLAQQRHELEQRNRFKQELEAHRTECEKAGNYEEAKQYHLQLQELLYQEERQNRESLKTEHVRRMVELEETHYEELREFNSLWDDKDREYEAKTAELVQNMKERHEAELHESYMELQSKKPKPKLTKELLNMRKVEQIHLRLKNYDEAIKQKKLADEKEDAEHKKFERQYETRCRRIQNRLIKRQKAELDALMYRINTGRKEQERVRNLELDRMVQRYKNIKKGFETDHKILTAKAQLLGAHKGSTSRQPTGRSGRRTSRSQRSTRRSFTHRSSISSAAHGPASSRRSSTSKKSSRRGSKQAPSSAAASARRKKGGRKKRGSKANGPSRMLSTPATSDAAANSLSQLRAAVLGSS